MSLHQRAYGHKDNTLDINVITDKGTTVRKTNYMAIIVTGKQIGRAHV